MVELELGAIKVLIPYQAAFEMSQSLRLGAKQAARLDRVPATFWRDVDTEDLTDVPRTHRGGYRRSHLVPNFHKWEVQVHGALVGLYFDGSGMEFDYELAVKLHQMIRRAARRAKAWAGDHSKGRRMLGMLTTAEDDDKLGLGAANG